MKIPTKICPFLSPLILAASLTSIIHAQTWQDISANVPGVMSQEQFANMATDGTRLYVLGDKGVFVSSDNGASFTAINAVAGGGPDLSQHTQRFIKFVNGQVWVGGGGFIAQGQPAAPRLHRLTPGQTVWQASAGGLPGTVGEGTEDDLTYDPVSGNYFGTLSTGTVHVSTDGGNNWLPRTNGLGGIGSPSSIVPVGGAVLTSRPLAGVLKTTDQGLNWSGKRSFGQDSIGNMIAQNGRLLITAGRTLHFSDDAGESWNQIANVPHGNSVLSGDGANLFAVSRNNTAYQALAYSASGGLTWHTLPRDGLPPIPTFLDGYYVFKLLRHGDFLFLRGLTRNSSFVMESTQLHRLDVSAFNFLNGFQIAVQPQGRQLVGGDSYQLSVYAGGENLTYQWRKNGEDLPEENGQTLLLENVGTGNAGNYTVVVGSGDLPELTSAVAVIEVFQREEGRIDPTFDRSGLIYGGQVFMNPDGTAIGVGLNSLGRGRIYPIGSNGSRTGEEDLGSSIFGKNLMDQQGRVFITGNTIRRILQSTLLNDPAFAQMLKTGNIDTVAELPGLGYLVGGTITVVNGVTVNRIALIGFDRVVNPDFPVGAGPNGAITHVTVAQDGGIYVAGSFSTWSGLTAVNGLVKLDAAVNASKVTAATSQINFVKALDDGRLLAKLGNILIAIHPDGTRDSGFNAGNHTITTINGAVQQPDGKIVLAGDFTTFAAQSVARYVRLNSDGSVDGTFYSAAGFSNNEPITGVAYDPRGYIYLAATASGNRTFQGSSVGGGGPIRIFATPAVPVVGGGFADWPDLASLPADQRGPNARPANDGVDNLVKFALGIPPLQSATARLPSEVVRGQGNDEGFPVVSYIRVKNLTGLTIQVEVCADLDFAEIIGTTLLGTEDLGDGTERVTVRSNATFASLTTQFFRLKVTEG